MGLSLPVAGLAAWDTLLADAQDCHCAWAMLAEVARRRTLFNRSVGVSYLMSAVGLSHDLRIDVCSEGNVLRLPGLANHDFRLQIFGPLCH